MKTSVLCLLLIFATVSATPPKPRGQPPITTRTPLSPFEKKVIETFDDAGNKSIGLGECHQLVTKIYGKINRAALIRPPSLGAVQKLMPQGRITRAEFVKLIRTVTQRSIVTLVMFLSIPPVAMHFVSKVPDELWLSFDLWIVDAVDKVTQVHMPSLSLPVINSHAIANRVLAVLFALALGNILIGATNTVLWLREGKDQYVLPPSAPQIRIPAEPIEPTMVTPPPPPLPLLPVKDTKQVEQVDDSNPLVAPLLVASALGGGIAAFTLDFSNPPKQVSKKESKVGGKKEVKAIRTSKTTPRNAKQKATDTDKESAPKTSKPPVGRIAVGGALVGCLQYAATVARFVGVLLP